MQKSLIKKFLKEQEVVNFKFGEVRLLLDLPYYIRSYKPDQLGKLYSGSNNNKDYEYWIVIKVCPMTDYNKLQRIYL